MIFPEDNEDLKRYTLIDDVNDLVKDQKYIRIHTNYAVADIVVYTFVRPQMKINKYLTEMGAVLVQEGRHIPEHYYLADLGVKQRPLVTTFATRLFEHTHELEERLKTMMHDVKAVHKFLGFQIDLVRALQIEKQHEDINELTRELQRHLARHGHYGN